MELNMNCEVALGSIGASGRGAIFGLEAIPHT